MTGRNRNRDVTEWRNLIIEAETLYVKANTALVETLGERHPNTLTCINNIGAFWQVLGASSESHLYMTRQIACTLLSLETSLSLTPRA